MTCGLVVCACGVNTGALDGGDGIARLDSGAELARDAGVTTQADAGKPPPDSGVTVRDAGVGTSADAGSPPPTCGNSTLEMGEACDGAALNGNTCSSLPGFTQKSQLHKHTASSDAKPIVFMIPRGSNFLC